MSPDRIRQTDDFTSFLGLPGICVELPPTLTGTFSKSTSVSTTQSKSMFATSTRSIGSQSLSHPPRQATATAERTRTVAQVDDIITKSPSKISERIQSATAADFDESDKGLASLPHRSVSFSESEHHATLERDDADLVTVTAIPSRQERDVPLEAGKQGATEGAAIAVFIYVYLSGDPAASLASSDLQGVLIAGQASCDPVVKGITKAGRRAVLPLEIGDGEAAGVIGSGILLVAVYLLHATLSMMYWRLFPLKCPNGLPDALADMKFPSRPMSVSTALWQGVSYEMVRIASSEQRTAADLAGAAVATLVLFVQPCVLAYWGVAKVVPDQAEYRPFSKKFSPLAKLFVPAGYWHVPHCTTRMMSASFTPFTAAKRSVLQLLPVLRALFISAVVVRGEGLGCETQSMLLLGAFVLSLIPVLVLRAHLFRVQLVLAVLSTLLNSLILLTSVVPSMGAFASDAVLAASVLSFIGMAALFVSARIRGKWQSKDKKARKQAAAAATPSRSVSAPVDPANESPSPVDNDGSGSSLLLIPSPYRSDVDSSSSSHLDHNGPNPSSPCPDRDHIASPLLSPQLVESPLRERRSKR